MKFYCFIAKELREVQHLVIHRLQMRDLIMQFSLSACLSGSANIEKLKLNFSHLYTAYFLLISFQLYLLMQRQILYVFIEPHHFKELILCLFKPNSVEGRFLPFFNYFFKLWAAYNALIIVNMNSLKGAESLEKQSFDFHGLYRSSNVNLSS